jgi:hypothetical protein
MPSDERTPLLRDHERNFWSFGQERQINLHDQFCKLVGIPPSDLPAHEDEPPIGPKTLYGRALRLKRNQNLTYQFTAGLSNTMLLSQVILGAALTALGASNSSHVLITIFGAMNTIIAGLVAYLKSRGQPMRARMYRDDLERVVDEIENSEIMWLGISQVCLVFPLSEFNYEDFQPLTRLFKNMHGYDDINIDDAVTVRSEVARLTRLYDRAVRSNTMNNPDMYLATGGGESNLALKGRPLQPAIIPPAPAAPTLPNAAATSGPPAPAVAPQPPAADPDESPATAPKPPPPKKEDPPPPPKAEVKPEEPKPEPPKAEAPKEATPAVSTGEPSKSADTTPPTETPKEAPKEETPAPPTETLKEAPKEETPAPPTPAGVPNGGRLIEDEEEEPATSARALKKKEP